METALARRVQDLANALAAYVVFLRESPSPATPETLTEHDRLLLAAERAKHEVALAALTHYGHTL